MSDNEKLGELPEGTRLYGLGSPLLISTSQVHEELTDLKDTLELVQERISVVEERFTPVEAAVAKIPSIEAQLSRVDRLFLLLQGDMRRLENSHHDHGRLIESKLDEIKRLILDGAKK